MAQLIPLIDSRKLVKPQQSLFFAINGEHSNGHKYIADLYERGVKNFVVEDNGFDTDSYADATFKRVPDTIAELQVFATKHRQQFNIPVVGITGSNGKTIVKEWLAQLLSDEEVVCKNPRSYNSQIGVPLSVCELKDFHTMGIFEAGISRVGEMSRLEKIIQPTVGIFTNIGSAHDEGFENTAQKIAEKLRLFQNADLLIYHKQDDELSAAIEATGLKTLSWSYEGEADVVLNKNDYAYVDTSPATLENIGHCIAYLTHAGFGKKQIQNKLMTLKAVKMRLELKKGINNCYLIDDSYNNDLAGLQTALEFMEQNPRRDKRTVILSDILQAGIDDDTLYSKVLELLEARGVQHLVGVGEKLFHNARFFNGETHFFKTTSDLLKEELNFKDELILVKGARSFSFEKVVNTLVDKQHKTVLEINLEALQHNLNYYRSLLKPETKIMVMVKAFAYGSGSEEVANLLQYSGVDYLAVAYTDEGIELRKKGIQLPIMVMNPTEDDFENLVRFSLEPEIYSITLLKKWINPGDTDSGIHLKLDTGMHRLGIEEVDLPETIKLINENNIKLLSCFTHLATADDSKEKAFTTQQLETFGQYTATIQQETGQQFLKHVLNSSGIISFPDHQYDMVRLGIGLYGYDPTGSKALQNVASLYTVISQLKEVQQGDTIGYGRVGKAGQDMRIATLSIGYADGYSRMLSDGKGEVYINGRKAKVVGNVCMDMLMVDVSGIDCKEGDRVEVFGEHISIKQLADKAGTIPYEILTGVSERVKRVYFR